MRVTQEQVALVQTILQFANLRRIKSTRQVQELFRRSPAVGPAFREIEAHKANAYKNDQDELRGWLRAIATGRGADVAPAISARFGTIDSVIRFDIHRLEPQLIYAVQGVQAACALGAAFLLSPSAGLTTRLGYCDAPKCGRFRIDLETRRGRPWRYCSTPHRRAADEARVASRMRAYRARHSKPRSSPARRRR